MLAQLGLLGAVRGMTRDHWQFKLVHTVSGEYLACLHVKFVAIPAFVGKVGAPCDNSASLRVDLSGRFGVCSFGKIAENIEMSTRIVLPKSPLPLLPVNHCIQDNSVPLAADARVQLHERK